MILKYGCKGICLKLSLPLPLPELETSPVVLVVNGRLGIMVANHLNSICNCSNNWINIPLFHFNLIGLFSVNDTKSHE